MESLHYCIPFIGVWAFLFVVHVKEQWVTQTTESSDDDVAKEKNNIDVRKNSPGKINICDSIVPNQCTKINSDSEQLLKRKSSNNENVGGWKCACEGGNGLIFLPQSLMKSFSGPGAAMRLGAGGCYHKQM
jgi:hypothetical protein